MAREILQDVPAKHESDSERRSGESSAARHSGEGRRKAQQSRAGPKLRTDNPRREVHHLPLRPSTGRAEDVARTMATRA